MTASRSGERTLLSEFYREKTGLSDVKQREGKWRRLYKTKRRLGFGSRKTGELFPYR
jgi:hypothetical protein